MNCFISHYFLPVLHFYFTVHLLGSLVDEVLSDLNIFLQFRQSLLQELLLVGVEFTESQILLNAIGLNFSKLIKLEKKLWKLLS